MKNKLTILIEEVLEILEELEKELEKINFEK